MVGEFWVRPALEVEGVRQIASYPQAPVHKKLGLNIHVEADADELRDRWLGYHGQATLWQQRDAVSVFHLRNALILGRSCIVMASDGSVLRESIQKPSKLKELASSFASPDADLGRVMAGQAKPGFTGQPSAILPGSYSVFTPSLVDNFYHWTVEALPRLALTEQFAEGMTPIVPPLRKSFQSSSLEAMNAPLAGFLQNDQVIQVENLVLSSPLARSNIAFAPMIRDFYDTFRRGLATGPAGRRIYISRDKTRMRRVSNENEIFAIAAQFGFERLFLEDLTFAEQASIFAEAEIIVGPHGAGFGNAVHCRPGTVMVELLHDAFQEGMTSFWALANMFDLPYHLVLGQADEGSARVPANSNFVVNPALFARVLAEAMPRVGA